MTIAGKNIILRTVLEEDAKYIVDLRKNENKNKYLSSVSSSVQDQKNWIKKYKIREEIGDEFYFVIEGKISKERLGLVRLYDLRQDSFCWGSWIIEDGAPKSTAIESALQVYEFGFNKLGYKKSHFNVSRGNDRVLAFHLRFGAVIVDENNSDTLLEYKKEVYELIKLRYKKYL